MVVNPTVEQYDTSVIVPGELVMFDRAWLAEDVVRLG